MRQFFWGMACGALAVYFYANYGESLQSFRRYTLQWRNWAVSETGHHAAGHDKDKHK